MLVRYALVGRDRAGLWVHRLIQAVVADQFEGDDKAGRWAGLLAHVLAAANHAEQAGQALEPAAGLLTNAGIYLLLRGEYRAAQDPFQRTLAIHEATLGPNHPTVARDRGNLGNVLRELGDLAGARGQLEQAVAIFEATLGAKHPSTRMAWANLADLATAD